MRGCFFLGRVGVRGGGAGAQGDTGANTFSSSQVFGTAPDHAPTSRLPQHGFARTSRWEFLGKSTSESSPSAGPSDASVKLDFGLSSATLGDDAKALWPHPFSLIYSVTLTQDGLATTIVVTNDGDQALECQVLLHTYLRVKVRFLPLLPPTFSIFPGMLCS